MSSLLHNKAEWKHNKQGKRGRPQQFSDLAITSALIVKPVFSIPLRSIQHLIIDAIGLKVFSEGE
ncbi:transposase DDE domain protein [Vibrio parahaemolyticus 50]|nr:transposase DDE domain protein [Vibrio parahaemolyticus 50]